MKKNMEVPKSNKAKDVKLWLKDIRREVGYCEFRRTVKQHANCSNQPELTHHIDGNKANNIRENILVLCNVCHLSFHNKGKTISKKTRQKISKNLKGKFKGKKHPMYNKHHSRETRKMMSKNHPNFSGKNNPMYGRKHSKETRQKMSKSNAKYWKGKYFSREHRQRLSKSHEGKKLSKESRRKMSFTKRLNNAVKKVKERRK